jgi:hypothetical protein
MMLHIRMMKTPLIRACNANVCRGGFWFKKQGERETEFQIEQEHEESSPHSALSLERETR